MLPKGTRHRENVQNFDNRRLNFMKLSEGRHIIRLAQPLSEAKISYNHWIKNKGIACLDEDVCPICINNQEILMKVGGEWKEARKNTAFNPYQTRYYIHILDRTPVKVSPLSETGYENKQRSDGTWPATCGETGALLESIEARPSNTIKVLSGGVTLFGDLENVANATLNLEGEPIPLTSYDLTLMVKGTGRERQVTPVPQPLRNDEVNIDTEDFFDLDRALIRLTPEEITDFLSGMELRDIFARRRAVQEASPIADAKEKAEATHEFKEDDVKETTSRLDELLG